MSNFQSSTQLKNWIFSSPDEIVKMRDKKSKRVKQKFDKIFLEHNSIEHEKSKHGHTPNYIQYKDGKYGKYLFLTWDHEIKYIQTLISNIIKICEHMKSHNDVTNTAIEYFKRFYLKQSVYDFDPIQMMFAAIYLAIKVEETNIRLSDFVKINTDCKVERLIQMETFLIKGLKFQFFVYSPYRCYDGFHGIMLENCDSLKVAGLKENLPKIYDEGIKIIRCLHYTD